SVQHSAFSIQRSAFSVQHSAFSVQHSAFSIQHSAFSVQHSAFSVQHLVLGIETATFCGGVAILADDRLIASLTLDSPTTHSTRLLGAITTVMAEAKIDASQLTGIAVSIGPGSFTGVRIGLAVAKGLALALNIPIVGVSTLEGLAVRAGRDSRLICPVVDARRKETFVAAYRWKRSDELPRLVIAPAVMAIEEFLQRSPFNIKRSALSIQRSHFLFLGDGALRYRDRIQALLGERAAFAPSHHMLPSADEIAWLGLRRLARGSYDDPAQLEPVYIRPSDARPPTEADGKSKTQSSGRHR
ncbi:tRNA (adenosine(37)-N6)-threonylcarbamoyltransferase complex dimerization subunit type 1 TsaB, partial [Candidatus Sumerlaeota bacterium]|nr:tRNA (adenosine(37)-N6)-threonylcarbamoyltransferase complex dimerization subunit type 1 TsaB [Candidatus Sumerlaeota bacterium]